MPPINSLNTTKSVPLITLLFNEEEFTKAGYTFAGRMLANKPSDFLNLSNAASGFK
jgi:hypothetical protein